MKEIVDALDAYLTDILNNESPDKDFKFWGLSELVTKDKDRFPVTINERKKVSIEDRYEVITHHRILSTDQTEDEEYSFGLTTAYRVRINLRTVLCHKITVGEDYRYDFAKLFPTSLTITGFQFTWLIPNGINEDHEQVYNEEWPNQEAVVYQRHRLPWNVCAFNTIIEFIKC